MPGLYCVLIFLNVVAILLDFFFFFSPPSLRWLLPSCTEEWRHVRSGAEVLGLLVQNLGL